MSCMCVACVHADASAVGVMVLQLEEIPPRPPSFDGHLCLFELLPGVDEAAIVAALSSFGTVVECDLSADPVVVVLSSHAAAVQAKEAGLPKICKTVIMRYNQLPYAKRGWCIMEDAATTELVARLGYSPKVKAALGGLPNPKAVKLGDAPEVVEVPAAEGGLGPRIEAVIERIRGGHFVGKGDKEKVRPPTPHPPHPSRSHRRGT